MAYVSFGYKMVNGIIVADPEKSKQVQTLFESYLAGMTFMGAAKNAGIECNNHASPRNMLRNKRYIGKQGFPAIISEELFKQVGDAIDSRAAEFMKNRKPRQAKKPIIYTSFRIGEVDNKYSDPFRQAEYVYSLIESKENDDGSN